MITLIIIGLGVPFYLLSKNVFKDKTDKSEQQLLEFLESQFMSIGKLEKKGDNYFIPNKKNAKYSIYVMPYFRNYEVNGLQLSEYGSAKLEKIIDKMLINQMYNDL
jgi:hypothetical protein